MFTHIILDVDGTLTDSGIIYSDDGSELKKFSARDGIGFAVAAWLGITVTVITGRECKATKRRMDEMGVAHFRSNVKNKREVLRCYMESFSLEAGDVCYIGDDVNDLSAMRLAGYAACPFDACREVREIADYISPIRGGEGAFRDIIEHIAGEKWKAAIEEIYG